ncbi:hypothetical protein KO502_06845 [Colwellia sp. E2M01]|nr:hypothetical protein [Colwellia sp. E2M01]
MLKDGDKEFRFISFNVPTLNYVEDEMKFERKNPYGLPSEFELHDVYKTIKEMGGQVVRSYTIPVRNTNFPSESITFVEAPGKFNEEAFKVMDLAIALAAEYDIRLIVPLLNNWQWMGGRPNYAAFRDKTSEEFWTDRQLIEDFKKTVHYVLNRRNTVTGILYKNDPTIMAWETGNELENPPEWGIEIARYIKSIDSKHLLIDGFHSVHVLEHSTGKLFQRWPQQYSIDEPAIDLINAHFYEYDPQDMLNDMKKTVELVGGKKPLFFGEFGFISTPAMERIVDYIIQEKAIVGGLIWSLRRHHPEGGFYQHSEPIIGYDYYRAYHWPGFNEGEINDERNLMSMLRRKAFEIQNKPVPPISLPEAPNLLPFSDAPVFSWQGSMGASGYNIERATNINGPWALIEYNIDDLDTPGFPLYSDESAELDQSYYYRIIALNSQGKSAPSKPFGPIKVNYLTKTDRAVNLSIRDDSRNVEVKSSDWRSFKEAFSRLHGKKGAWIRYHVPGKLKEMRVYAYEKSTQPLLSFDVSKDNTNYQPIKVKTEAFTSSENNYDYLVPRLYTIKTNNGSHIRANFNGTSDIVRVEIDYY